MILFEMCNLLQYNACHYASRPVKAEKAYSLYAK